MKRLYACTLLTLLAVFAVYAFGHPYLTPSICYGLTLHPVPHPYHPIPCGWPIIER